MKIKKIISKNKDGDRMEVIAEIYDDVLSTRHIRKGPDGKWYYDINSGLIKPPELRAMEDD